MKGRPYRLIGKGPLRCDEGSSEGKGRGEKEDEERGRLEVLEGEKNGEVRGL